MAACQRGIAGQERFCLFYYPLDENEHLTFEVKGLPHCKV